MGCFESTNSKSQRQESYLQSDMHQIGGLSQSDLQLFDIPLFHQQIEIFIACRELKDLDVLSKSDPQCIVKKKQNSQWVEIGRTEVKNNNLNPDFIQTFKMDYIFEELQELRFEVYDIDPNQKELIGIANSNVAEIVGAKNSTLIKDLLNNQNKICGKIILRSESVAQDLPNQPNLLYLEIKGQKLANKALFGKSDPFITFSRVREDQT